MKNNTQMEYFLNHQKRLVPADIGDVIELVTYDGLYINDFRATKAGRKILRCYEVGLSQGQVGNSVINIDTTKVGDRFTARFVGRTTRKILTYDGRSRQSSIDIEAPCLLFQLKASSFQETTHL